MDFVLGANGRLGKKIVSSISSDQVIRLERSLYADWYHENAVDQIARFFNAWANQTGTIYIAAGIIDPKKTIDEHYGINFLLAKNIILAATKVGFRVVTFGTVMENILDKQTNHPYFSSKIKLGDFVSELSVNNPLALHVRMHTLYGGETPNSFMFLGELFHSIVNQVPFPMSLGEQLREYHHLDDEIKAIFKLVDANINGCIDISHGNPITLKELATYVLKQFGCLELLKIGARPCPPKDNYEILFKRNKLLHEIQFRDTLPAIVKYLQSCEESLGVINGI
jgi:nucleoside-diphosphate-sugar epimerase